AGGEVVGDDRDHELGALRRIGRARRELRALVDERLGLRLVAVPDAQLEACLLQVRRHARAHRAQPDECHGAHVVPFSIRLAYSCTMRVLCALLAFAASQAFAQPNWPEQSVRILVGFTAGVAPDVTARLLAEKLGEAWGKPVVVENVTGAGGNIGAARVAKAPADGYTLGMIGNGSLVFSPSMYDKLAFDPQKDFAPITQV